DQWPDTTGFSAEIHRPLHHFRRELLRIRPPPKDCLARRKRQPGRSAFDGNDLSNREVGRTSGKIESMHAQLTDLRIIDRQSCKIVRQLTMQALRHGIQERRQFQMRHDGVVDLEQQLRTAGWVQRAVDSGGLGGAHERSSVAWNAELRSGPTISNECSKPEFAAAYFLRI